VTLNLEAYQAIMLAITIGGSIFGAGKAFFGRIETSLKERDDGLKAEITKLNDSIIKEAESVRELERRFMQLQIDLPEKYVNREDYNRQYATINLKLDKQYELITQLNNPKS
jgi:chromosome segregation ATPase